MFFDLVDYEKNHSFRISMLAASLKKVTCVCPFLLDFLKTHLIL